MKVKIIKCAWILNIAMTVRVYIQNFTVWEYWVYGVIVLYIDTKYKNYGKENERDTVC